MPHPSLLPASDALKRMHERGWTSVLVDESRGARQLRLHLTSTDPGRSPHPPHAHAGEEILFILEGRAEVQVAGDRFEAGPESAVFFPEHVLHGLRVISDTPLRFLVIKIPDPTRAGT